MYYSYSPFDDIIDYYDIMDYGLGGAAVGAIVGIVAVLYAVFSLVGIALYVLQSLGLFTAAKRRGIRNYGLAWVPVAYLWVLGSMADQYDLAVKGEEKGYRRKLIGFAIAAAASTFVGAVLLGVGIGIGYSGARGAGISLGVLGAVLLVAVLVLSIISAVFQYIALYKFYMSSKPGNAVVFLVLGIFFHVLTPIFLFVSRNQDLGFPVQEPEETCCCGCCEPEADAEITEEAALLSEPVSEITEEPAPISEPAAEPEQTEDAPSAEE